MLQNNACFSVRDYINSYRPAFKDQDLTIVMSTCSTGFSFLCVLESILEEILMCSWHSLYSAICFISRHIL